MSRERRQGAPQRPLPHKRGSEQARLAALGCASLGAAVALALLGTPAPGPAAAETVATFTRNPSNPILRSVRIGAENAGAALGAQIVHYIPRSEAPPDQLGLIDEVIRNKPDALVLAPYDSRAMAAAVDRLNAAGIAVTSVHERLAGGNFVAHVGTDDYQLALATARHLAKALGGKGSVVILEGPENLPGSVARSKGLKDALKEFPELKLVAARSASYARALAVDVMKGLLRSYPQLDGVIAANDRMAIGAIEALKAANRKALVAGINAEKEALDLVKLGDLVASGDYNGFLQGCLAVEIALRHRRGQAVPQELILKPVVVDKDSLAAYETPMEQRPCPPLESVVAN
jgi:ribose transport system substrate-binding protein